MAAISDFTRNAITKAPRPYVRHAWKPYGTHQSYDFAPILYI